MCLCVLKYNLYFENKGEFYLNFIVDKLELELKPKPCNIS
jgi:hypothetical protein